MLKPMAESRAVRRYSGWALEVKFDGGFAQNVGAVDFKVTDPVGNTLVSRGKYATCTTNNQAECLVAWAALRWAVSNRLHRQAGHVPLKGDR